ETPDTSGIAHFAEHMFFKGTESRPTARDIGSEIDGIGGEFNAFTGKEYTGYYVRCAGEHRSIALDVLVDMLRHSKFDSEKIDGDLAAEIERLLGDLEPAETGAPAPAALPANGTPRVKIHTKASDQAHLCLGVPSYPLVHPDRYSLQVLATVLGTGMSSRLF